RRLDAIRGAGRLVVELADGAGAELDGGRLVRAWGPADALEPHLPLDGLPPSVTVAQPDPLGVAVTSQAATGGPSGPVARDDADELLCVTAWLDEHAHRVRLLHADAGWAFPLPMLPRFDPRRSTVVPARHRAA
ncbi:MAG TPA: hypothetical protein VK866_13235, partial [Acidimicrobiales bacterium]|nr:hypothetical protein [Acidimicrobiales bacterium]